MSTIESLLDKNRSWSESVRSADPEFFPALARQQAPEYLWIGCSDARVSANQLCDLQPGEVFVHRNIANLVVASDLNCLSVMQYAVEVLKVKHIIVCGHYGCGGIKASLSTDSYGLIDNWLRHINVVARLHSDRLEGLEPDAQADLLCELNVVEQVGNVCNTNIVRNAWDSGQQLAVHGCIYNLEDGLLHELIPPRVSV